MNLEQVPNSFPHLFLGYSIIFIILAGYILYLSKKANKIEKMISDFEAKDSK